MPVTLSPTAASRCDRKAWYFWGQALSTGCTAYGTGGYASAGAGRTDDSCGVIVMLGNASTAPAVSMSWRWV